MCDTQRLRILNLLEPGPLCVCHILEVLEAEPIKLSKQLKYMKGLGMVEATRDANFQIYRLAEPRNRILLENLACLQDCGGSELPFKADLRKRAGILAKIRRDGARNCPEAVLNDCC